MTEKDKPIITTVNLAQKADSCHSETQELTIEVCDAGGGPYLFFQTTGWAVDIEDLDSICEQLKQLCDQYDLDQL